MKTEKWLNFTKFNCSLSDARISTASKSYILCADCLLLIARSLEIFPFHFDFPRLKIDKNRIVWWMCVCALCAQVDFRNDWKQHRNSYIIHMEKLWRKRALTQTRKQTCLRLYYKHHPHLISVLLMYVRIICVFNNSIFISYLLV